MNIEIMHKLVSGSRRNLLLLLTLLCLIPLFPTDATSHEPLPAVERISFTERADGKGLVVRFHMAGTVHAYSAPDRTDAQHIEFHLFNTVLNPACRQDPPRQPVYEYTATPWKQSHLKVRLQIDPSVHTETALYRDRDSDDLLLSLTYISNDHQPAGALSAESPRRAEPAKLEGGERWKLDTIVIDAGHGGKDHGAEANGLREKDVTLAVAFKVGRYLKEQLGINVIYTRQDDRFIELKERGRLANRAGGKLFLSIHVNAAKNTAAAGTETFFLGMHRSDAAKQVMERENSVVQYESDPAQYQDYDDRALILQTLAQSAYMRKSEQLSGLIENELTRRTGRYSRGVKQAGFYVLWSASMPAVLIELGFLTNKREAGFLKSEAGQNNLANAIFEAVSAFRDQYEKDLHLVNGQ